MATTDPAPPLAFLPLAWRLAGVLCVVFGLLLFKFWTVLGSQLPLPRVVGVFAVIALAVAALGALAAVGARALGLASGRWLRLAGTLFYGLALANVAAIGLTVFYQNPRFAPLLSQQIAAGLVVVLFIAYLRFAPREQAMLTRLFTRLGQGALVAPWLLLPLTLWGAVTDRPTMPGAPQPRQAAALRADRPPRILLITFDALRTQSTPLAGAKGDPMPTLGAIARQATVYPAMRAASDFTIISLPTLLSGLRPGQFMREAPREGAAIRQGFLPSLAAHLKPAGYTSLYATMGINPLILGFDADFTDGFSTAAFFDPNMFNTRAYLPLAESFGWLTSKLRGRLNEFEFSHVPQPIAVRLTFERAHALLKAHPGPTFLWIHIGAPHAPYYDVPRALVGTDAAVRQPVRVVMDGEAMSADAAQLRGIEEVYQRYADFADGELGRFKRALMADGLWDDSLLVITADHGEDFTSPGFMGHASGLLPETVTRVPLLVREPGQRVSRRDPRLTGHIDLAPTVLSHVFEALPSGFAGHSLTAPPPPERVIYSWGLRHRLFGRPRMPAALVAYQGAFKYHLRYPPGQRQSVEALYDLTADPDAQKDVQALHPGVFARLRDKAARDVDLYR